MRKNLDNFKAYCYGNKEDKLNKLAEDVKKNVEFLEKLKDEKGIYYFYDLIANAKRRAVFWRRNMMMQWQGYTEQ